MDLKVLSRQGLPIHAIARLTGFSRATVRKALWQPTPPRYRPRPPTPKKLDPYVPMLEAIVQARPWVRATVVHQELQQQGYPGHYEAVKVWLRQHQQTARRVRAV